MQRVGFAPATALLVRTHQQIEEARLPESADLRADVRARSRVSENIDAAAADFRRASPLLRLSGLFIVGFPSETEEDFQQTLACIARNYHDGVNIAPYSDRAGAAASLFPEKIDGQVIRDRIERAMTFLDREKITWTVSS